MNLQEIKASSGNFKITCKNFPAEFIMDKNVAKEYFCQFGKLKRVTFRPKLRICTIEYANKDGYLNALNNSGEYNGTHFEVYSDKSSEKKKKKSTKPIWLADDEVQSELSAMGGEFTPNNLFGEAGNTFSPESISDVPKVEKVPKLKRSWITETPPTAKKKLKSKEKPVQKPLTVEDFPKQMELISVIKSQAFTAEEKYKVLDARDKLIRIKLKQKTNLKSSATIGTCPDMCPEKERLMRETQHQVALYEQEDNGRSMNPSKAIKQYSRSSADQETPLSHELRPVSVLQMTMGYMMHNIIDMSESNDVNLGEWYHFMWDRTRGIRKDITQQELCSQGAVELIEQCARFHVHCSARLVAEDPSVFDQKINTENLTKCLQSLKYMYHDLELKGERCPNEAEFRAYIILLNLNDGNFMWEVQELREDIQKSKEVKFALEVYSALDKNNYVKFFKLVCSTSYLNACILMRYFVQVRVVAIKTLLKCYTSRAFKSIYPLDKLKHLLAFDDIESTVDFMRTYGVSINEQKTHIVLEKNTFMVPELPYVLDRSLNVVESKKTCSVGKIVCGKDLPARTFDSHVPQNSFDASGRLVFQDLLKEIDLDETDLEDVSEKVELSSVVTKSAERSTGSASAPNVFSQNVFGELPMKENSSGSIFAQPVQEPSTTNIFSRVVDPRKSIFAREVPPAAPPSVFDRQPNQSSVLSKDETDLAPQPANSGSIFGSTFQKSDSLFGKAEPIVFGAAASKEAPIQSVPVSTTPKRGGFYFELPRTAKETVKSEIFNPPPQTIGQMPAQPKFEVPTTQTKSSIDDFKELQRKKDEELERRRKEMEEVKKRDELERKRLETQKKEEERLKRIKKRKQEEELKKRMKQLKEEEDRRKESEIRDGVTSVLKQIVENVTAKISRERSEDLKNRVQRRLIHETIEKWRRVVLKNKRKRKAMDCSPVWVNTRTLEQSAEELHSVSQDLTLRLRKRYKLGKPLDIDIVEEDRIDKIDLFKLTYATLNQRFFNLKGILQKNIYWKVKISVPDHYELDCEGSRMQKTLGEAFQWEERNGSVMAIEQVQPNPMQSITYCIERQRGMYVREGDCNGIIFIAKDFNSLLQRRMLHNLKELGVFTKIPIVIILQVYDEKENKLGDLIDENIVSDYLILVQNITPRSLVNLVQDGLVFLAGKVEKPPPLELDTTNSFLEKYLCTEIWKRANSFAKWNSHYKSSLRNPNIVIGLYNEALSKLKEIVLNKSCFEYPSFPDVFKDYLQSEIPDCLPCNYCYFPKFWKSDEYTFHLKKVLKSFELPKWREKWPPSNEIELEVSVSKYCTEIFREPEKIFYRVMSVMLKDVDPTLNFKDVEKVLWTDVMEVLAMEKLRQAKLGLNRTPFETKSIFNQFVVIYDVSDLEKYKKSDWFYLSHPTIKKYVEEQLKYAETETKKNDNQIDLQMGIDLDKTIAEVTNQLQNGGKYSKLKDELAEFNTKMNDLENCIRIHKKISSRMEDNLRKAIAEN